MTALLIETDTNETRIREVFEVYTADLSEVYGVKVYTVAGDDGKSVISASLCDADGKALRMDDGAPYIMPSPMQWQVMSGATDEQKEAMRATIMPSVIARAALQGQSDATVEPLREVPVSEQFNLIAPGLSAVPFSMLTSEHGAGSLTVEEADPAVEFAQSKVDALLHDKALMEARWAEMQNVMATAIAEAEAELAAVATDIPPQEPQS
jgi:hypothetical protein